MSRNAKEPKPRKTVGVTLELIGDPRIHVRVEDGEVWLDADADGFATLARLFSKLAAIAPDWHDFIHLYPVFQLEDDSLPLTVSTILVREPGDDDETQDADA